MFSILVLDTFTFYRRGEKMYVFSLHVFQVSQDHASVAQSAGAVECTNYIPAEG